MNNSIIAIDILPGNDGKVIMYGAPDKDAKVKLFGKLRIVLSKPLKTKFIAIHLKGKSEYSDWENQYSCINVAKYENIIREKLTLPLGVTDLDYEFELPANIPQTYVTPYGLIKYKLVAIVQPTSLLTKYGKVEKPITFQRHYLPCKRDLLPAPPTKIYKGQRKNILKYELDVPTVTCVNDRSVLVRLRLLPLSDQGKIEKVSFDMIQSEKYRLRPTHQDLQDFAIDGAQLVGNVQLSGSSSVKRVRSHPIKPTTLNVCYGDDTWDTPLICNLPFTSHATSNSDSNKKTKLKASIKSPLIRVRHKLKITLKFQNQNEKRLELTFPIIVTTVPEESDFDGGLPSYDDVIGIINNSHNNSNNENHNINNQLLTPSPSMSSNEEEDDDNDDELSSNNNTRPVTPTNDDYNSPPALSPSSSSPSSSPTSSLPSPSLSPSSSSSQLIPNDERCHKLRQKKSQSSLAQSLGRLLLRSDSTKSKSKSSVSASTSPESHSLSSSSSSSSLASLATTDQSSLSVVTDRRFRSTENLKLSSSSSPSNNNNHNHNHKYNWFLNRSSDNDDDERDSPEICSAPSSPRQSKLHSIEFNISLPSPTLGF